MKRPNGPKLQSEAILRSGRAGSQKGRVFTGLKARHPGSRAEGPTGRGKNAVVPALQAS